MVGSIGRLAVPDELLRRCQQGDEDAFHELFLGTVSDVHRILYRLAGPDRELEDLVQQVYLALLRSLPRFEGRSSFSTYLFGICLKVAKKRARSAGRFAKLRKAVEAHRQAASAVDEPVARAERAREVHRVLSSMSFKLRTVLVLYEMEGLGGREIAEKLGIPEATVWTRLHHARRAFIRSYKW